MNPIRTTWRVLRHTLTLLWHWRDTRDTLYRCVALGLAADNARDRDLALWSGVEYDRDLMLVAVRSRAALRSLYAVAGYDYDPEGVLDDGDADTEGVAGYDLFGFAHGEEVGS